jgi:hypothetical protein
MAAISIKQALNKAFIKQRPDRAGIELCKTNLIYLLDTVKTNAAESEKFLKNLVSDFLKNTWYAPNYFINTAGRIDLVVHTGKDTAAPVGIIRTDKTTGYAGET